MTATRRIPLLALLLSIWACHAASAATIVEYHVTVDTSSIVGNPAAPFFLNFQFNDGSGTDDGNNTVTIGNFSYGAGGGADGTPMLFGGASGSLSSGVTLTDNSFFNAFTQQFTPGSLLSFDISITTNVDAGDTPDLFTLAILHSANLVLGPQPIPTAHDNDQLLTILLNGSDPTLDTYAVEPFPSNPSTPPGLAAFQPTIVVVPEPGTTELATLGLLGLLGFRRLRAVRA